MLPNVESFASWSDEELLAQYHQATSMRDAQDSEAGLRIEELADEIQRRGLVLPDDKSPGIHGETDGVLPEAESATGEPGISPPITPG
jgi:hypothetical protein